MTVRILTCQRPECGRKFRYVQHRSPNYPKYCADCAKLKMKASQKVHDERRRHMDLREAPKSAIDTVPERNPKGALSVIEQMKRLC